VSVQVSGGKCKTPLVPPIGHKPPTLSVFTYGRALSKFVKGNLDLSPLSRLIYLVQRRYALLVLLLVINHVLRFKQSIFHSLNPNNCVFYRTSVLRISGGL
jgi:hypothetical protein